MAEKKVKETSVETVVGRMDDTIQNLKNKDFKVFFFVVDSKNVPNGSMNYIYRMAKTLQTLGYNVEMLYQLDDEYSPGELAEIEKNGSLADNAKKFVGVGEWMGEEYASLPHLNIQKEEWKIGPSDFLFIPEVFSSIMFETFKQHVPCKRYVVLQNFGYVTEFIPFGHQWITYGIDHVVSNTSENAKLINDVFPYTEKHTTVIPPYIDGIYRKPVKPKKLVVNIVSKNKDDINRIMKPFYWKYPVYQFVSFSDLRGFSEKEFAERLKDGMITVWIDEDTPFGYSALQAMRCGNIVIGKIPKTIPEWMSDMNGVWFTDINDVPEILSKVVATMIEDEIPEQMSEAIDETSKLYTYEEYEKNLSDFMEKAVSERIDEINELKELTNKENNETTKNEQ